MIHRLLWLRWRSLYCWSSSCSSVKCDLAAHCSGSCQNCLPAGETHVMKNKIHFIVLILAATTVLAGCEQTDDRLVRLSEQSVARQAEQNHEIAQQSKKVAEATHELVRADARARAELIEAQHELEAGIQAERDKLDQQRLTLEQDRQSVAAARVREPVIAEAIGAASTLLVVSAAVVLCIYLIRATSSSPAEPELNELLLTELMADQPSFLLPKPPLPVPLAEATPGPAGGAEWTDFVITTANDVSELSPDFFC